VRRAYALVGLAAALPRLGVLAVERSDILAEFTEKSDDFATTLVASGTFGFIPGEPSAYTQPLYGFFLAALYWPFGRSWLVVGLAQVVAAVATAWLVYAIGTRFVSPRAGLAAALIATLNPYLVWHDVHVNREILDGLIAAALVLSQPSGVRSRWRPAPACYRAWRCSETPACSGCRSSLHCFCSGARGQPVLRSPSSWPRPSSSVPG
jgi:Dolichyl-phosphate-mannose-protein mannosyltransferase